jgi:putative salt-induced outer membrane protein YdiY
LGLRPAIKMRGGRPSAFLGVLFLVALPFSSFADEVVLSNGDRLTGKVKGAKEGVLVLTTEYSEPVHIRISGIRSILTEEPVEVHLTGGEVLRGRLRPAEAGRAVVEPSAERQGTVIDLGAVKAINPPSPWSGNVAVGGNLQTGNTKRLTASIGAEALRRTERDRFSLRLLFNYAEEDDTLTARNTFGALKYDHFFTPRTYWFLNLEMLSDEFKDLNLRTSVGPGVGYQVWDDPAKALSLEIGVNYFSEDLDKGRDDQWITGRASAVLSLKVLRHMVLSDIIVIYPRLDGPSRYQLRNEAGLTSSLGSSLALRLTNIVEYDSDPSPGIKKTDTSWILALQYGF